MHTVKHNVYILLFATFITSFFSPSVLAEKPIKSSNVCAEGKEYEVRRLDSKISDNLCSTYAGKAMLIVNTASRCGYTYQYEGLQKLYNEYKDKGLVVIGFPSNNFSEQEPGTESSIKTFCRLTYDVEFPMYAKSEVVGKNTTPLYQTLYQTSGERPGWNFHKYLIDKNGNMAESFPSRVEPGDTQLIKAIEQVL